MGRQSDEDVVRYVCRRLLDSRSYPFPSLPVKVCYEEERDNDVQGILATDKRNGPLCLNSKTPSCDPRSEVMYIFHRLNHAHLEPIAVYEN